MIAPMRMHSYPWLSYPRLSCLLALLLLAPGCQSRRLAALNSQAKVLSEQNKTLSARVENLQTALNESVDERANLEVELAELDEQVQRDRRRLAGGAEGQGGDPFAQTGSSSEGAREGFRLVSDLRDLSDAYPPLAFDPLTSAARFEGDVRFDSGRVELRPPSRRALDELAAVLRDPKSKSFRVMVVGHTDDQRIAKRPARDRWPSNFHLSTARAQAVADYLMSAGIGGERIGVLGFGAHQPSAGNDSASLRSRNRRVEIYVLSEGLPVAGWSNANKLR